MATSITTTPTTEPTTTPTTTPTIQQPESSNSEPVWIDENSGEIVPDALIYSQNYGVYNDAISQNRYSNIIDPNNNSIFIAPNTYYYYSGLHSKYVIPKALTRFLGLKNPTFANRIYQISSPSRYLMLSNNYIEGTLNPITTEPAPTKPPYPTVTIISEALKENSNKLDIQRYEIIDTQQTLNDLTARLNNIKLKLNSINKKPMYSASGDLTFF